MAPQGGFPGITDHFYQKCISKSTNTRVPASPTGLGEHSLRQFECRDYRTSYLVMSAVWLEGLGRPGPLPFFMHSHKLSRPLLHLLLSDSVGVKDFCKKIEELDFDLLAETSELDADQFGPTFIGSMEAYLTSTVFQGKVLLYKLRKLNYLLQQPGAYEKHYELVMGLPVSHSFDVTADAEATTLGLPKSFLKRLVRTRCNRSIATENRIAEDMLSFITRAPVFQYDQLNLDDPLVGTIEWILSKIQHHPDLDLIGREFLKLMMLNSSLLFQHDYNCYDQHLNFSHNTARFVSLFLDF